MEKSYCIHNFDNDAFENRKSKSKVWNDYFILRNNSPWQFVSKLREVTSQGVSYALGINEEDGLLFIRGVEKDIRDFMELVEEEIEDYECGELKNIKDQIDFHCTSCDIAKEDGRGGNKKTKFILPSVTNSYVKILESIMDNGEITVALPKQFIEKFDNVYEDIKGVSPDYDNEGYCLYKGGEDVFSYKTSVKLDIPDGMTLNDIAKILNKHENQIQVLTEKRIEIFFTDWVIKHLFPIGFDLGRNHDVDAINKWISKNSLNV